MLHRNDRVVWVCGDWLCPGTVLSGPSGMHRVYEVESPSGNVFDVPEALIEGLDGDASQVSFAH